MQHSKANMHFAFENSAGRRHSISICTGRGFLLQPFEDFCVSGFSIPKLRAARICTRYEWTCMACLLKFDFFILKNKIAVLLKFPLSM